MTRAVLLAVLVLLAGGGTANAFTVNSGNDVDDGTCNAAHCSLREAIDDANANASASEIDFDGTTTVVPAAALPTLVAPVTINGTTTPACGGLRESIALDGNGAAFDGLTLGAGSGGSRLCSLNIRGFRDGIRLDSAGNTIDRCRIGTGLAAEVADPNSSDAIEVVTSGDNNTISDNVLSGNTTAGVRISNTSTGNVLAGNMIGTDDDGEESIPNQTGVILNGGSTVGGTTVADRNVISGNTGSGVEVINGTVVGNHIGTDDDGLQAIPNGLNGVVVDGSLASVGGVAAGSRNLISGNAGPGVLMAGAGNVRANWIGPTLSGGTLPGQSDAIVVPTGGGGAVTGNVIAGHDHYGVVATGQVPGLQVRENQIGVMPDGTTIADADTGVFLDDDATNTLIDGNTIAGNSGSGIETEAAETTITGNTIGLDTAGNATVATRNDHAVNVVSPADDTFIGGDDPGDGNRLTNSVGAGVRLAAGSSTVQANTIDRNGLEGLVVTDFADALIGGTDDPSGNVITENTSDGVLIVVNAFAAVLGNSVHANGTGATDVGIDIGANGATPNDGGDIDNGPNHFQNTPVVTAAETDGAVTAVGGIVDTMANHRILIELFASGACDPSGFGEGEVFLGRTEIVAGSGDTGFSATVGSVAPGTQITATATDLDVNDGETSEFSACFTATQKPADPDPPTPPPPDTGATPPPPGPIVPLPIVIAPVPKFPAKLAVLRNGVDDGVLDMLIQVTSRSVTPGAVLELDYNSSGKHTRFTVPITSTQIKVRRKLPKSQPKDTGIVEIEYDGNDAVSPDEVRLRAADGKSKLVRTKSSITNGRLAVEGTISKDAKGVVRIRLGYDLPDGSTKFLNWNARIRSGTWKLSETLPTEATHGGQLSIQFTGYEPENLRGEQVAKQVLA